ncbi:MAG: hypothetical protein CSA70_08260 [Rhodobacterales bacterium]|nr:MAG: hypothetical protein CSA70_08260 [Rhodobacterales bacterium]
MQGGFGPDTLPRNPSALYHLDYLDAQARNGGFSQFIGNSGNLIEQNFDLALEGAEHLVLTPCQPDPAGVELDGT